jgi:serine/threonine protein kinase
MGDIVLCEEVSSKGKFVLKSQKSPTNSIIVPIEKISYNTFINDQKYSRFKDEAIAYVKLIHPNIVDFYGFEIVRGIPRILLTFVEGGSLYDWIAKIKSNNLQTGLKILIQIATGLKVAHENGLIHRDLKPSNILMKENHLKDSFVCKISDFGIVKIYSGNKASRTQRSGSKDIGSNSNILSAQNTSPNSLNNFERISLISDAVGTPVYGAPEQFGLVTGNVDQNADLFAFGIIAAELLTGGRRPRFYFWYQSSQAPVIIPDSLVKDVQKTINDHFSKYNKSCPQSLIRLITKCVGINPSDRWKEEKLAGTFSYFDTIQQELAKIYASLFGEDYTFSDTDSELNNDMRYLLRGRTLKLLGQHESQIKPFYDHVLNMTPRNFQEWSNKSKFLLDLGKRDEALKAAETSIGINSNFVLAWYNKGNALDEMGRHEEAIEAYDKAIEIEPNYGLSFYYKAKTLARLGRYDESLDAFCRAIQLDEFDIQSWYDKEKLLFDLQLYDDALKCLKKIIKIDPYHSNAWFRKGEVLFALNRIDEGLKCYDRVVELEENALDAWENRGTLKRIRVNQILASAGSNLLPKTRNKLFVLLDDAERSYNKALDIKPGEALTLYKRAALFIERSLIDKRNKNYLECNKINAIHNSDKATKIKFAQWFFFGGAICIPLIIGFALPFLWTKPLP